MAVRGAPACYISIVIWFILVQCAVIAQHSRGLWESFALQIHCCGDYICVNGMLLETGYSDLYAECDIS